MDTAAELGRNLVDKAPLINRFRLSVGNGHDDAGRDAEQGQANIDFTCSAGHEEDWQPYYVTTIHTYSSVDDLRNGLVILNHSSPAWSSR